MRKKCVKEARILVSNQGMIIKVSCLSIFGYQNVNCIAMTQVKYMLYLMYDLRK
jgi:hypothetical protein